MVKRIVLLVSLLFGCRMAFAQESRTEIRVGFRVGTSTIDPSFGGNAAHLSEIVSFLEKAEGDSTIILKEVRFSGYASPEGGERRNRQLAAARLHAIENYVRSRIAIADSVVSRHEGGGIAWEYLAESVEASDMPHKEEALRVLREVPERIYDKSGKIVDGRKKQLMELQWGRTWHYMAEHFFARLRNACTVAVTVTVKRAPAPLPAETEQPEKSEEDKRAAAPADTPAAVPAETAPAAEAGSTAAAETEADNSTAAAGPAGTAAAAEHARTAAAAQTAAAPAHRRPFYMALKSNLLYDVLAVPNIGAEFYLGRNWSAAANWMYGWWDTDRSHRYWRVYGGEVAVRKWFGRRAQEKPLTGHHLGLYGQLFTFDFEWGGKGYMGGEPGSTLWDEPNYAAGVEYGYSLPVGRRLNLDFTIGAGYWGGKYHEYSPVDGHYVWQSTKRRRWFGPTKAEISLVWLLGRGNRNAGKGGAQ